MSQYYRCTIIRSTVDNSLGVNLVSERIELCYDNIDDAIHALCLEYKDCAAEIFDCNTINANVGGCVFGTFIVRYKVFEYSDITREHFITIKEVTENTIHGIPNKLISKIINYK